MNPLFLTRVVGKEVYFTNLTEAPTGTIYQWGFGDGNHSSDESPHHTYNSTGFYKVTLTATSGSETGTLTKVVVISEAQTVLPGSIYTLVDNYLPKNLVSSFPFNQKELFITKWQLYLQPLVNHEVPLEEYNNELYYEALENQLIMELAMYDFMVGALTNLLQSKTSTETETTITQPGQEQQQANGNIKKITTGPTEVEFFDKTEQSASTMSAAVKAVQPGGILDVMRKNICMLAERLEIYLPICQKGYQRIFPEITNTDWKRPLKGPNPVFPLLP